MSGTREGETGFLGIHKYSQVTKKCSSSATHSFPTAFLLLMMKTQYYKLKAFRMSTTTTLQHLDHKFFEIS